MTIPYTAVNKAQAVKLPTVGNLSRSQTSTHNEAVHEPLDHGEIPEILLIHARECAENILYQSTLFVPNNCAYLACSKSSLRCDTAVGGTTCLLICLCTASVALSSIAAPSVISHEYVLRRGVSQSLVCNRSIWSAMLDSVYSECFSGRCCCTWCEAIVE